MQFVMRRCIRLFMVLAAIGCSFSAQAAYHFVTVDYPGAVSTQLWGINDSGQVVGQAFLSTGEVSFLYDPKNDTFTPLLVNTGLIGINDSGAMAGGQTNTSGIEHGVILKNQTLTTFSHPGFANTEARGIGDSGLVTGWAFNLDTSDPNNVFITSSTAFIYNPAHNSFTDFFPSTNVRSNIAQGINRQNQVVGGTPLFPGPVGNATYGYRRDTNGAIKLFLVNNSSTRARGITDSGQITGFVSTPGGLKSFVGSLSGGPGFIAMVIPDADLLRAPDPAAVDGFAVDTAAQGIDNFARVVGAWDEGDGNFSHGFIATPIPTNKDQCKGGGWQGLVRADGTAFKNQGDCIQYVNTGK